MVKLTNAQKEILDSLRLAIWGHNVEKVRDIFEDQKFLRLMRTSDKIRNAVLEVAIQSCDMYGLKEDIEVIGLIWQKADQRTRDFLCSREYNLKVGGSVSAINILRNMQEKGRTNDSNKAALEEVIQEMEEHKRVKDLNMGLKDGIISFDVDRVKAALENCGEYVKSVLERRVYWEYGGVDAFLVYPLKVKYSKELNQEDVEKIKDIFKLMFDATSLRLLRFEFNGNYVMSNLVKAQERFAKIPGVGEQCFQDLIQEFEGKLSKDTLDNAKTDDQIAWDREYATQLSQRIDHDLFENDTTFWSKHKGKIALGAAVVCTAGAVAAYVLAYPAVVALLAVLAAVILMGAGIAKVLEDPSVEGLSTSKEQGA